MPTVAERIVTYAREQLGDPYVWGAEGPNGFDCSGLVYAAYKAAGMPVTRTTAANLGKAGKEVAGGLAAAQLGDVLYFDNPGTTDHVAIYSGNGRMIEAPTQGVPVREVTARKPTSVRRWPLDGVERVQDGGISVPGLPDIPGPGDVAGAIVSGISGIFGDWQNGIQNVALKVTAGTAVVGLVIVGARLALQDKGTT